MGTSKMRDRLSRVTDAPVQSARRGGLGGLLRGGAGDQHGHDRDGGPISALRGQIGQQTRHQDGPSFQQTAWGAAGRAGTAMAGAAGLAARAGQSAGSALAGRASDISGRMTEHVDDQSWSGRQGARLGGRGPGRQWDDAGQSSREQRGGRSWDQPRGRGGWDEPARPQRWGQRDDAGYGWDEARRSGNGNHGLTARLSRGDEGDQGLGGALGPRGSARGDLRLGDDRPGRDWEQHGGLLGPRAQQQRGRGRRRGQRGHDQLGGWDAQAGRGPVQRWERPDLRSREELIGGQGLPKRHTKRIEKAHDDADESARRAFEASERAMRHSHSRRALKDERKAVAQADRAQRLLDQHLARAQHRVASAQRRRRHGLGLLLLAGAGAGITIAARRLFSQPSGGQPAGGVDQTGASATRVTTTTTRYPADDRPSDGLRDDVTAGHRAGTDTMSDSTSRRF
jgi:hypothetical protein